MTQLSRDEQSKLLLLVTLLLGMIVRFFPAVMAGFPVNDGGMFYVMVGDLKANGYLLPPVTQYNLASIPFAYPPLGFYVTALISDLLRLPELSVVRWLPPFVNSLSIPVFYLLALRLLRSPTRAGVATLFYAFVPSAFGWQIMGGGITRAFGILFMLLTLYFADRMFARGTVGDVLWTALAGSLAVLGHPEAGIQTAAACVVLWVYRDGTKPGLLRSLGVTFGVLFFTAPWWGTLLSNHGLAPVMSALGTGDYGVNVLVELLTLQISGGIFFSLTIAMGLVGLMVVLARREFMLGVWFIVPFLVDPRSAAGVAVFPLALLAGTGFDEVVAPGLLSVRKVEGHWLADRYVPITLLAMTLYMFLGASIYGIGLANSSLSARDRETIAWVDENIPPGSNFLLVTGQEYSMLDPVQEWFPALTGQRSQTTLQGYEWTLGGQFFPRYGELVALQHCPDVTCVETWSMRTGLDYQYLLIKKLADADASELKQSVSRLAQSVQGSDLFRLIYESENALVFEKVGYRP